MQSIHVTLPEPCQENWDAMDKVGKGRFCMSCQKTIVDFTAMTDQEMLQFFRQSVSHPCGWFANDQLNRTIALPRPQRFWMPHLLRLLLPAFLLTQRTNAHAHGPANQRELPVATAPFLASQHQNLPQSNLLRGRVSNRTNGKPIAYARIKIKGLSITATTDSKGFFTLAILSRTKNCILQISCTGYQKKEMAIKNIQQQINIQLKPHVKSKLLHREIIEEQIRVTGGAPPLSYDSDTGNNINKPVPLVQKIIDTLTGNNKISLCYKPLPNGTIALDMKNVQKGDYLLQLLDAAGHLQQYHSIAVPAGHFAFDWQISSHLAAGTYSVHISNANGKAVHSSKLMVLP
jgi:hypothetical protein